MANIDVDARTNASVKASQAYMNGESQTQDTRQYNLDRLYSSDVTPTQKTK